MVPFCSYSSNYSFHLNSWVSRLEEQILKVICHHKATKQTIISLSTHCQETIWKLIWPWEEKHPPQLSLRWSCHILLCFPPVCKQTSCCGQKPLLLPLCFPEEKLCTICIWTIRAAGGISMNAIQLATDHQHADKSQYRNLAEVCLAHICKLLREIGHHLQSVTSSSACPAEYFQR